MIELHDPTLTLVYLPHLDYDLQRHGPNGPKANAALRQIDEVCGELIDFAERRGIRVIALSEYGITPVRGAVHINRVLREAGHIQWRVEEGEEHLDPGLSDAFAVADHQVAHVYVRKQHLVPEIKELLEGVDGIERVLDAEGKREAGLDHARSGELVAVTEADRWFSYYWWLDDRVAPDYARTVDIHSKPGYDPCELLLDPEIPLKPAYLGAKLLRSKVLNLRTLLDVIPLDTSLLRGSHGRPTDDPDAGPLVIARDVELPRDPHVTDVRDLVLRSIFE